MKVIVVIQKIKNCYSCPHLNYRRWGGGCEDRWFFSYHCKKKSNKILVPAIEESSPDYGVRVKKDVNATIKSYPKWCPLPENSRSSILASQKHDCPDCMAWANVRVGDYCPACGKFFGS